MESLPSMRVPSLFARRGLPGALNGAMWFWRLRAHHRLRRLRQGRCSLERWRRGMIVLTLGRRRDAQKGSITWHTDEMGKSVHPPVPRGRFPYFFHTSQMSPQFCHLCSTKAPSKWEDSWGWHEEFLRRPLLKLGTFQWHLGEPVLRHQDWESIYLKSVAHKNKCVYLHRRKPNP